MIFFGGNNSSPPVQNKVIVFVSHKINYLCTKLRNDRRRTISARVPRNAHADHHLGREKYKIVHENVCCKESFFFRWWVPTHLFARYNLSFEPLIWTVLGSKQWRGLDKYRNANQILNNWSVIALNLKD